MNYKEGKQHGSQKSWYENGQLQQEMNYKEGKLSGLQRSWNEK